jgi:hypothetical protein
VVPTLDPREDLADLTRLIRPAEQLERLARALEYLGRFGTFGGGEQLTIDLADDRDSVGAADLDEDRKGFRQLGDRVRGLLFLDVDVGEIEESCGDPVDVTQLPMGCEPFFLVLAGSLDVSGVSHRAIARSSAEAMESLCAVRFSAWTSVSFVVTPQRQVA